MNINIKTKEKEYFISSIEDLKEVKEMLYNDGYHLSTFRNKKNNIYTPLSNETNDKSILDYLEEIGVDTTEYKRDDFHFTSINNDLIEAIVSKEEMKMMAEHENKKSKDLVLISIQDPDDKEDISPYQKQFKRVLPIRFFDVEDDIGVKSGGFDVVPLNDEEAKKVADFIYENKDEKFFIHCAAGMSRSAGVGMAVDCIINHNGSKYSASQYPSDIKNHHRYSPNYVVYDKIVENFKNVKNFKFRCSSCDASFNKGVKGVKEGREVFSCPVCFAEVKE